MHYHLDDDEIQLLLDLFGTLGAQGALTSSLELLNTRLRLSLSSDSDSCCCCLKTFSDDLGPPTELEDHTLVQQVSLKTYHCKNDSNLH